MLDAGGRVVSFHLEQVSTPTVIAAARAVFVARHVVADEIERLMALLDALSGDDDLELNLAGSHWNPDPRLDDTEGVTVSSFAGSYVADEDAEPSLAGFGAHAVGGTDVEDDPAESGIADLDGLAEQFRRTTA